MAPASDTVGETPENPTEQPLTNAEQVRRRLTFSHLRRLTDLRDGATDTDRLPE